MTKGKTPKADGLWKPFSSYVDRFGYLHVREVPRGEREPAKEYCRRVARCYTLQAGIKYRNKRLKEHHAEGKSVEELGLLYGLRQQQIRELLYSMGLEKRPEPPKPMTPSIKSRIIRMRQANKTYAEIASVTGMEYHRAAPVWAEYERKKLMREFRAERKRKRKELSGIAAKPPSILEHLEDFDA